ncbi:Hypothetical predicted protein [Pelobates cultripes]|uniref:Uncharacterized protein n=1 Tax=Pelobates cultripes TaxID=61616 RepID=A0AAD1TEJ3_PELCU|nr:Hypothetical predicted protein [Pelobates cultripes]
MGNENTHVANASQCEIYIFFQSTKLHVSDIAIGVTTDTGTTVSEKDVAGHLNVGTSLNVNLKSDTRIQFLTCPSREYTKISLQGDLYTTIVLKHPGQEDTMLCMNFMIPSDRSIIVTDKMIKFTKYGYLWMDEAGNYH